MSAKTIAKRWNAYVDSLSEDILPTENILDGFLKAWRNPGYNPAALYVSSAFAAGLGRELENLLTDEQKEKILEADKNG